ncbi:iron-containing alcohol dehydrogenase [Pelistega suis]|uniref:iron-containing alcohol dehydrogenase n=1 Tax=Pelistega suis TaxID=1631957 RepID=UPI00211CF75F|nr:iron-containing alcohol dehydrogenase [Pelistega suis]MCQ9329698.1 iron-containing alcohol dehydrogenase [Pelistega suis]MDY3331562.1 iron-containing alcohol dehydrogenase [Pelistega sp.]
MSFTITLPRLMEIGKNACQKLPSVLAALGVNKPLIITDKIMVQLGYIKQIQDILAAQGIDSDVHDDTIPEPTESSILSGVEKVRTGGYDSIIALGGGSPIDSAKAIAILGKFGGTIRDYKFPRQVNETGLPIIAIPTTAGTGSEATKFTIITDEEKNEKLLCVGVGFLPVAAIIDYTLTLSVPARTTADTGIDAMTHAIEAYVSQKQNPYSEQQALAALRLIGPNLQKAYHDGKDEQAREAMMLGSTLAGIAFNNASVALVHGMSRPIGAFFHVPHGLSNAMLLPAITEFSIPAAPSRYADCARALGVADSNDNDTQANDKLLAFLKALNVELKVPTLAEFGVEKAYFDSIVETMCEQAFASGSPNNNPRIPSKDEMLSLYRSLWT